jgi:hypothetical protein
MCFTEQKGGSPPNSFILLFGLLWRKILKNSLFVFIYQNVVFNVFSFTHKVNRKRKVWMNER